MQVSRNELFDLKIIIIRIYRAHAHIDQRIAHAGVLPVDQAEIPVRQEQEVIGHTVNVRENPWTLHGIQLIHQLVHVTADLGIILKTGAAMCRA